MNPWACLCCKFYNGVLFGAYFNSVETPEFKAIMCKPCHDKKTWGEDSHPTYTY